ncbi:MAG: helix-turn-helix domain-containing protein [Deltaproteobacteria bacterium]|nr:helix-turn-helix domain-containing protein [Deltaproteobacteria bacterium]
MRFTDVEAWRASLVDPMWDADVDHHVRADRGGLQSNVDVAPVGPALINAVSVVRGEPVVSRDRRRIATSRRPLGFGLSVVQRGHATVWSEGREVRLGPGDVCLLSGAVPFAKHISNDYREVLYLAPHASLEPTLGRSIEREPSLRSGLDGFARVLALQVDTLVRRAHSLAFADTLRLTESTHLLLGVVFGDNDRATRLELESRSLRQIHRQRALDAIGRLHADPELDPAAIAQHCRISVRYLHALFAGEPSVSTRLLAHRLERCRAALASGDPRDRTRTIGEIAFSAGFNNLAHFCRTFKARFGVTPSEARARS